LRAGASATAWWDRLMRAIRRSTTCGAHALHLSPAASATAPGPHVTMQPAVAAVAPSRAQGRAVRSRDIDAAIILFPRTATRRTFFAVAEGLVCQRGAALGARFFGRAALLPSAHVSARRKSAGGPRHRAAGQLHAPGAGRCSRFFRDPPDGARLARWHALYACGHAARWTFFVVVAVDARGDKRCARSRERASLWRRHCADVDSARRFSADSVLLEDDKEGGSTRNQGCRRGR
jgi:hypothetical protein